MTAAAEMVCGAVWLTLLAVLSGDMGRVSLSQINAASWAALLYLVLFGSLVAFTCFAWLLKVSTPAKVSTAGYVNPMVAVFLGWAFHGEKLTGRSLMASLVIILGVALIISGRRTGPKPAAASATKPVTQEA